jgi:aldehyde:ferredoxin oxidoreductase
MKRRILQIEVHAKNWRLETLPVESVEHDPREDYFVLSGETLCQYLLRRDSDALVIARGPMPFLSGNKASVGYISPLTGLPHYSFVGGRAAAQLLNLGLDGICFGKPGFLEKPGLPGVPRFYLVISGRAPNLCVEFKPADEIPPGQRSAYYWLVERELGGRRYSGSVFTLGEAAFHGYRAANLGVDAIYHAGRGGAGAVLARSARAVVLRGEPLELAQFFPGDGSPFTRDPNAAISPLLEAYCARLSRKTGGTITKLVTTGADPKGRNTLPAWNARRMGYAAADLGDERVLKATRDGQTGCHWCQVDCRHYHWVPVDYAPEGRDMFLDDFEPTYALFAMLGLVPEEDSLQGRLDLLREANQHLILPIEQLGCDAIDVGVGLAALLEGIERGLVPESDVPEFLRGAGLEQISAAERLQTAVQVVEHLRSGAAEGHPALRALGDGPQALAERYPGMQDVVFTSGKGTLANAGHCNALWTFLMPFSRFFGHYSGQFYKVDAELPPPEAPEEAYRACFEGVVGRLLQREFFWLLANALSQCAFTFVIFSQEGKGERLSDDDLLVRLLRHYGIHTSRSDLEWFSQAFWAQSIDLKGRFGWRPPTASDLPRRIFEGLSLALDRSPEELSRRMDLLIDEWKRQAGEVLYRFGYDVPW